jgi:hypothetical protein
MKAARNGEFGVVFVIGLAAAGLAGADPATDAYNEGTQLLNVGKT